MFTFVIFVKTVIYVNKNSLTLFNFDKTSLPPFIILQSRKGFAGHTKCVNGYTTRLYLAVLDIEKIELTQEFIYLFEFFSLFSQDLTN